MSNIDTLTAAGLIAQGATFSDADTKTINNLSQTEINALINVYNTVGLDFLSRNCGSSSPAASSTTHPIGIVF
jgi:NADP-dependent 3-hydroxy acid dehydrogenase YdfG